MKDGMRTEDRPTAEVLVPSWADGTRRERGLVAGFCTRRGGYGTGRFAELNFSRRWPDPAGAVDRNVALLADQVGFDLSQMFTARQVHGGTGLACDGRDPEVVVARGADFLVCGEPGRVVAVITADCIPVLLWDPDARCVAAVHAGWRGIMADVIQNAVSELVTRYQARADRLFAAVGPGIDACCFEVGSDVADRFAVRFGPDVVVTMPGRNPHVDLFTPVAVCLDEAGLSADRVERLGECTCCHPDRFFSYRRDGVGIGQHLSFIGLLEVVHR